MVSKKELTAEEAKSLKNKVDTLTKQDQISLDFLYQRIRSAAKRGEAMIEIHSKNKTPNKESITNTTDKILGDGERLDRDVLEMLIELDFSIREFEQIRSGEWRTLISWRDSDLAEFSSFAFGLRHTGGFPIV